MPYCTGCGDNLGSAVGACPKCGTPITAVSSDAPGIAAQGSGLNENIAGFLCYVVGWLTGLIFFLIDKRPFVRFHAAQSMVTFGGLHLIQVVLVTGVLGGMGGVTPGVVASRFGVGGVPWMILSLLQVLGLIAWIVCMVKAYQGERFHLPITGGIADSIAKHE